jgi:hypothetical protein
MSPDDGGVDHQPFKAGLSGNRLEQPVERAVPHPSIIPPLHRLIRPEPLFRQVSPASASTPLRRIDQHDARDGRHGGNQDRLMERSELSAVIADQIWARWLARNVECPLQTADTRRVDLGSLDRAEDAALHAWNSPHALACDGLAERTRGDLRRTPSGVGRIIQRFQ